MSRPVKNRRLFGKSSREVGNPSHPGKTRDKVSKKISKLRREGKPQDEAVATALSMDRRGDL